MFKGKGKPVDEIDQLCHSWQQCRSCNAIDNENEREGFACDPITGLYEVFIIHHDDSSSVSLLGLKPVDSYVQRVNPCGITLSEPEISFNPLNIAIDGFIAFF